MTESDPITCPLCGGPTSLAGLLGDGFYGVTAYRAPLYRCATCASLFQQPVPDRETIAGFYPSGYWQEGAATSWLARLQRFYVAMILAADLMRWVRRLRLARGAELLDIGCSRGDWLAEIRRLDLRVQGLEADPRAAAYARRVHGLEVAEVDDASWQPEPGSFQAITFFHLLEHVQDPGALLDKIHAALAPGGQILMRVPNPSSLQARCLGWRWKGWEFPRHLTMFSPRALYALLKDKGFEVSHSSTWSLRDGPTALSSSLLPAGEPTWQQIKGRPSAPLTLVYLALTWLVTPLEFLAAACGQGANLTVIAVKR